MIEIALVLAAAAQRPPRTDAPPIVAERILLVGDSTVAVGSGWGGLFCAEHVKSSVACLNLARGGRSTRSYRQEGSWAIVRSELAAKGYRASYVLIQFGHNDQSDRPERWTDLTREFPANLTRYVAEVRNAGGIPILVTPLARRAFRASRLDNTLAPWAEAVRRVAAETRTPLIDLNADSAALIARVGPVAATAYAMTAPLPAELAAARTGTTSPPRNAADARLPDVATTPDGAAGQIVRKFDYTHLGDAGARVFATIVANDLARAVPALRTALRP